jgi:uncharacterized protein with NRDE domain
VTNYRDLSLHQDGRASRGHLVRDFLTDTLTTEQTLLALPEKSIAYNPFNLLIWDATDLAVYSSVTRQCERLEPGVYGLSNHHLNTPWPKVNVARERFERLLSQHPVDPEAMIALMQDQTQYADKQLPDTGVGLEMERALSPLFVHLPDRQASGK